MRRFCMCFSFLLAVLSLEPSAIAQDELKLNQTYRDVIRLHFPAGQTQIPLEGTNAEIGRVGSFQFTTIQWTNRFTQFCDAASHIYCFQR